MFGLSRVGQVSNHIFSSLVCSIRTYAPFMTLNDHSGPCPSTTGRLCIEHSLSQFIWPTLYTWSRLHCLIDQLRFVRHSHLRKMWLLSMVFISGKILSQFDLPLFISAEKCVQFFSHNSFISIRPIYQWMFDAPDIQATYWVLLFQLSEIIGWHKKSGWFDEEISQCSIVILRM